MFSGILGMSVGRERRLGKVIICEHERGLRCRNGKFLDVVGPGKYRVWPFTGIAITVVDVRRAALQITNQKMLTSDHVTVTMNLVAQMEIADLRLALYGVANYSGQVYVDVQLAARAVLAATPLDELLTDRGAFGEAVLSAAAPVAGAYGILLHSVGMKDVIFSPHIRNLLMRETETRRLAQAALNSAREEVAAMRALLNAARLTEQHPNLLRLRELEVARTAVQTGGNTLVLGMVGAAVVPTHSAAPSVQVTDEAASEDE